MARSRRAKKRLIILAAILAIGGMGAFASYGGLRWYRAQQATRAFEEGRALFEKGDYAAALPKLSLYVSRNQEDVQALLTLAKCREEVPEVNGRHLIGAANFYRAALRLSPGDVEALRGLVGVYRSLGFATELEDAATQLLAREPKDVAALEALVALADSRGLWDVAEKRARELVAADPDDYRWRVAALHVLRRGGADAAKREALVREWMAAGEPDGRYRVMLAEILATSNRVDDARTEALAASERGMPDTAMLAVLIDMLDVLGASDAATQAIATATARGLDPIGLTLMQTRRHWLAGRLADAELALAGAPEPEAGDERRYEIDRWRVILAESANDATSAANASQRLIAAGTNDPEAARHASWAKAMDATRGVRAGRVPSDPAVRTLLAEALAANRADAHLLVRSGDLALAIGDVDEAVRLYRAAFEGEGRRWSDAGQQAAQALLRSGRTEEGFRLARELVARFPENITGYLIFAEACTNLAREGRVPALVDPTLPRGMTGSALLAELSRQLGGRPVLMPALATAYLAEGDRSKARETAMQAIEHEESTPEILLPMALSLVDERLPDVPEALLAAAEKAGASRIRLASAAATVELLRGNPAKARQIAAAALPETPSSDEEVLLLRVVAEAAARNGDADATSLLARALAQRPDALDMANFILAQEAAWRDESLITAAIDTLRRGLGAESQQVILAEATKTLRFQASRPDAVAKGLVAVNDLVRANPESPAALVAMSRLLATSQPPDYAQAANFLEKAIALQPARRELYPELVVLLQAAGNYQAANRYLQQFMRSSEGDTDAARLGANLLVAQGQYTDAVRALEQIAAKGGTEFDLISLADAQRRAGRLAEAEATFAKAAAAPERGPMAVLAFVEFLGRAGRVDDARRVIEEDASRAQPTLPPVERAAALARLELDYGDASKAGPYIAEAQTLLPDNAAIALLAARHRRAIGDEAGALAIAQKALATAPGDADLLTFVSTILIADANGSAEADKVLATLEGANPAVAEMLRIVRSSAGADGQIRPGPDALRAAEALAERYPTFTPAWTTAAQLYAAAGRNDDAIRIARRGMLRLPTEPGPAEIAARLLLVERRYDEARDAARTWRALAADSPFAADLVLAEVAVRSRRAAEAVTMLTPYLDRMTAASATDADGVSLYTLALLLDGQPDKAHDLFAERIARDPAARGEWLRALRAAPTEAAKAALDRAEQSLASEDGRMARIAEYAALGRRSDGASSAARGLALMAEVAPETRSLPAARALAADLACIKGDLDTGIAGYEALWNDIPASDREALLRWGSLDAASKERLAESHLFAVYASNNMASTLAKVERDLDKALAAIDRAVLLMPGDPTLLDTKSQVHLARKEYDVARTTALAARALPDAGPGLDLTLARIELAAGRIEEARSRLRAVERALAIDSLADPVLREQVVEFAGRL